MNGIVHPCSHPEDRPPPSTEEEMMLATSKYTDRVVNIVAKRKSRRLPQEPGNWIHDGRVLLDRKNHPVKCWPGLNKTLSTEIESWRWEALMGMFLWLTVAE